MAQIIRPIRPTRQALRQQRPGGLPCRSTRTVDGKSFRCQRADRNIGRNHVHSVQMFYKGLTITIQWHEEQEEQEVTSR